MLSTKWVNKIFSRFIYWIKIHFCLAKISKSNNFGKHSNSSGFYSFLLNCQFMTFGSNLKNLELMSNHKISKIVAFETEHFFPAIEIMEIDATTESCVGSSQMIKFGWKSTLVFSLCTQWNWNEMIWMKCSDEIRGWLI